MRWLQHRWPTVFVLGGGVVGGGLHAAALIFWVAPEGHRMRDAWVSAGLALVGVWTLIWIGFTWFMMWISNSTTRNS